jgi:phosphoglycerate kinase
MSRTLADLPIRRGTRVLLRADFNCPLRDGRVAHDFRLREGLEAVRRLRELGAITVVATHLGRPGGVADPRLSLRPVVEWLADRLAAEVRLVPLAGAGDLRARVGDLAPGDVVALENVRFDPGEAACADEFADELASLAELHVHDAFGAAHRRTASTVGVARRLPSAFGPLLERELSALVPLAEDPPRPFTAIVGGAQPRSKLPYVAALLERADRMLLSAQLAAALQADTGDDLLRRHGPSGSGKLELPADFVTAGERPVDVGPATVRRYAEVVAGSGTVLWNGALGEYGRDGCREGTRAVAAALASSRALGVVGGATTVIPFEELGIERRIEHVSTGGGSLLHLFAHRHLPGLD